MTVTGYPVLPGELKLGKTEARPRMKDFVVTDFLDVERVLASPLPYHPHDTGFPVRMYANGPDATAPIGPDGKRVIVGDCVFGMKSNAITMWRHTNGLATDLNGATAVHAYSEVTGYVIGDESTDQGTDMGQAAEWWRKTGMKDLHGKRHKIDAWARFDPTNLSELTAVIQTFGGAGLGINFPGYAMDEFNQHEAWTYQAGGQNEGGHAIWIPKRRRVFSWAREFGIGDTFIQRQADEGIAYVSKEFLQTYSHKTPEGYDEAALDKLLAGVK